MQRIDLPRDMSHEPIGKELAEGGDRFEYDDAEDMVKFELLFFGFRSKEEESMDEDFL